MRAAYPGSPGVVTIDICVDKDLWSSNVAD